MTPYTAPLGRCASGGGKEHACSIGDGWSHSASGEVWNIARSTNGRDFSIKQGAPNLREGEAEGAG